MVLPVAGGRRQVLMVQLMMMGVRSDGAAAKDILDEERCPAGGSSVLAWLSLLLLAGRLHLFSFDATLRLRRRVSCLDRRGYILARGVPWRDAKVAKSEGDPLPAARRSKTQAQLFSCQQRCAQG